MATTRKVTSERESPQGGGDRPIGKRWRPFVGLFLAAFPALLTAWLMHAYVRGFDVDWGPIHLHRVGSESAWTATLILLTLAAVGLSVWAWHATDSRKPAIRRVLTGSVAAVVIDFAYQVGTGPTQWGGYFGVLAWWIVAAMWALPRLDVARRDPRNEEPKEDGLLHKLGLDGYHFRKPKHTELNGEIVRTDIPVTHAPGGTVEPLRNGLPNFESLADSSGLGGVAGMSTVRQGEGASTSTVSIIHKDILKPGVPYERPGLRPDGSRYIIDEPLPLGRTIDLELATESVRSTQGVMGTTGAGKSAYMRVKVAVISARSWVAPVLYFDKVKGKQSAAPVMGALGVCVLSNDVAPHKAGLIALERMLEYRANLLGELGYDEWEPGIIDRDGNPVPKVIAWFEESDVLIDVAPGKMVYLASKARSTGIVPVWSLQRADGESMPTRLRANVANWTCFGVQPADDYSAGFALGDDVIKAGAAPYWGDTKPGYHYRTERETPSERWPVVRRIFNASREEIESVTREYGPGMMPIDPGTIAASAGWYEQAKAERDALAESMTARGVNMTESDRQSQVRAGGESGGTATATAPRVFDPIGDSDEPAARLADRDAIESEIESDIADMRESGEIPANPDPGTRYLSEDDDIPPPRPEDELSWEPIGGKPPAKDRAAAVAALFRTLVVLSKDDSLRDPADASVTVFTPATIVARYPFRSRPWFSETLADIALGEIEIPAEYGLTLVMDDSEEGHYRLHSIASVTELHPDEDAS